MSRKIAETVVEDPDERSWKAEANRRWEAAKAVAPEEPFAAYDPVPLPDWNASRPAGVSRDLLGRFLHNRDTGIVHDCFAAVPACELDTIRNGTFYHFWEEVQGHAGDQEPCSLCLP